MMNTPNPSAPVQGTPAQEVHMKIAIVRGGETVEIRRRTLVNPTYEVVAKVGKELARGRYRLQYTDEDGDVVTMSSQEEWEECLSSWDPTTTLKIRVEMKGRGRCRSSSSSNSNSSSCGRRGRARSSSPSRGQYSTFHAWLAEKKKRADAVARASGENDVNSSEKTADHAANHHCRRHMRGWGSHPKHCDQTQPTTKPDTEKDHTTYGRYPYFMMRRCPLGLFNPARPHPTSTSAPHTEERTTPQATSSTDEHNSAKDTAPTECRSTMIRPDLLVRGCPVGASLEESLRGLVQEMHGKGFCGKGKKGFGKGKGWCGQRGDAAPAEVRSRSAPGPKVEEEKIGGKCGNCEFKVTGVVEGYCCRACKHERGHGRRCEKMVMDDADDTAVTEPVTEAQEPVDSPVENPPVVQPYSEQIAQLESMGFTVTPEIVNAVIACKGDISVVLSSLLL